MQIIIREAVKEDAPLIAQAVAMAIGEESAGYYGGEDYDTVFTEIAAREDTQYSYLNAHVAEMDGIPVGIAVSYDGGRLPDLRHHTLTHIQEATGKSHLIPDETGAGELYLDSLFVLPEYRGRGIGTRLLEAVISKAHELELPGLGLLVDHDNPSAERLYTAVGFERQDEKEFLGHPMHHLVFVIK